MYFKRLVIVAAALATSGELHAQYSGDALRFSQIQYGSTARFKAVGAQIGVGGDLSSLGSNPAGIGLFTRSEISITPEFNNASTDAGYLGQLRTGQKDKLGLGHAGVVWVTRATRPKGADLERGWLSFNFGFGYNRTNAFGSTIAFSGTNTQNSVADYYSELATANYGAPGTLPAGSLERMAYDNYLIGYDQTGYYFPETDVNNVQSQNIARSGSQSEVNFAVGANYSNTFYIGASIGLASINYNSNAEYKETGYNVTEDSDYSLSFRQDQITKGSGINAKLGAIFRPSPNVRIGATVQTPTWYSIDDSYSEVLDTEYDLPVDGQTDYYNSPEIYDFSYRLRTPLKLSGGVAYFFGNNGFLSADLDYQDFSSIHFSSNDNLSSDIISDNNRAILDSYQNAVNFRIGGEYKFDQLMVRAGYGIQGSPYKANTNLTTSTYSGGIGYRFNNVYVDLTYQNVAFDSEFRPYTLNSGGPAAALTNSRNNVFFTVGTRF